MSARQGKAPAKAREKPGRTALDDTPHRASHAVADFIARARDGPANTGNGREARMIFALDATMSRGPTWDRACAWQADMFVAASGFGRLAMQLVYFRGFGECAASKWVRDGKSLAALMGRISCRGGRTQIARVLQHAIGEARQAKLSGLVYIGDCMEENGDVLCDIAGQLGILGVPAFVFQEGADGAARPVFQEIARLTRGAWFQFSASSSSDLADLLKAAAIYATAGRAGLKSLERQGNRSTRLLLSRLPS